MSKYISAFFGRVIANLLIHLPNIVVALVLRLAIKERKADGSDTHFFKSKSKKHTLLALDSERYRGDLDVLSQYGTLRILHLNQGWESIFIYTYFNKKYYIHDILNAEDGEELQIQSDKIVALLRCVLSKLYLLVKVDAISTVHFKYLPDYYWTLVSEQLGVPYIMLYRECNLMSPIIYDIVVNMMKKHKKFHGSHVVVHNEKCSQVFLDADFFNTDKITIASALRMDDMFNKIKHIAIDSNKNHTFVLFYFPSSSSTFGTNNDAVDIKDYGFKQELWDKKEKLYTDLHNTIFELAKKHSDIDFIVKPKRIFMHGKDWNNYMQLYDNANMKDCSNYLIQADVDVHNLIDSASLVCGMQSSTTVESAIFGKRVVLPMFYDFMGTPYFKQFPWRNYTDSFDIACNADDFESIFNDAMQNPLVPEGIMIKRTKMFFDCFADLEGNAAQIYSDTIVKVIEDRKQSLLC